MGIDKTIKLLCHVSHINTDVHYINLWTTVNIIIPPIKPYFPISILSALKLPYVIYKSSLKQGSKNGVFSPIFYPNSVSKPLYVVVNLYYFSSEPQCVIRIILLVVECTQSHLPTVEFLDIPDMRRTSASSARDSKAIPYFTSSVTASTCLECAIMMTIEPGTPLASKYIFNNSDSQYLFFYKQLC